MLNNKSLEAFEILRGYEKRNNWKAYFRRGYNTRVRMKELIPTKTRAKTKIMLFIAPPMIFQTIYSINYGKTKRHRQIH